MPYKKSVSDRILLKVSQSQPKCHCFNGVNIFFKKCSIIFSIFYWHSMLYNATIIHQNHNIVQSTSGPLGPFFTILYFKINITMMCLHWKSVQCCFYSVCTCYDKWWAYAADISKDTSGPPKNLHVHILRVSSWTGSETILNCVLAGLTPTLKARWPARNMANW